jgi:tetratricopeptide (TPR) repeat protein
VAAQRAATRTHPGVLLSGIIPPLADPYFERPESGPDLRSGPLGGEAAVLNAPGGTGKTQLAAGFAHTLRGTRAVEVLVWVTATSREAVVAGFAQAAGAVGAGDPEADAEAAAARFIGWLARIARPWAVVIDDLGDLADLAGLWPAGPAGQVVITTRLPAAAFTLGARGLRIVPVGPFSRREALSYLGSRLADDPDHRIEALDLAEDLECLPLGLAQAAAVMNVKGLSCREYRAQFGERHTHMSSRHVDGVSAAVLATWSLAAECAHELEPAGLTWPALALIAMLDPHGIPGAVLTSPAACGYIAGRPSTASVADQNLARAALTNLARVGLVGIDPAGTVRTVRMHPSVPAAVRAYLPPADTEQVLVAAADALVQAWPEPGQGNAGTWAQLDQALRDCAASLRAAEAGSQAAPGALWRPEAHPLLLRVGRSLEEAGLAGSALAYWQSIVAASSPRPGPGQGSALAARDKLAAAYESAGRFGDALAVFASTLADREHTSGPEHPDTIAARGRLAHAYASAGRPAEAVALYEHTVTDAGRVLGPGNPVTLTARAALADAYRAAGRDKDSLAAHQALIAECQRLLGARHPTTLAAWDGLAAALAANGQSDQAVELYKSLLADAEATAGRNHPDTIAARGSLAYAYRSAGRPRDAIALYKRVLSDRERIAGTDHPDTIAARANLAAAYQQAGRLGDAVSQYARALADSERYLGPDHPTTQIVRGNLDAATAT